MVNYLKGLSTEERKKFLKEAEKAAQEPFIHKSVSEEMIKMWQGQRLFDLGFGELFKMGKDEFLSKIPLPKEGRGRILVVSAKYVSPEISMTLNKVNGKHGKNYLDLHALEDMVSAKVPAEKFYWRYSLLYKPYLGKSPLACEKLINDEHRLPGTANEAVYVCAQHPEILGEQWLDCLGSRCRRGRVPCLHLCDDWPELLARTADCAHPHYGSFSFGSGA